MKLTLIPVLFLGLLFPFLKGIWFESWPALIAPVPVQTSIPDSTRWHKALSEFRLEEGLEIALIAAEPQVIDPVAFAFDAQNKLYVIEDRGYPDPIDNSEVPAVGRIALLTDKDGDGRFESRTEFATNLTYPNGILPWKGGIFVTCAPHIYYFKDTDGDGIADIKDIVLTGFNANQTAQIRVSHPTLGLDGWVYITSGLNNGKVTSPKHPERPAVSFTASDGRFHPETFVYENTGGRSQYGLAFDPFGRRFGTSNRHPVMQMMLEPWQLQRNKLLQFTETYRNVSAVEAQAKVFPISGAVVTAEFIPSLMSKGHTGTFTSACGILPYYGDALGETHRSNMFICEPAQNLVQRQIMTTSGVSFTSTLPYEGKEFLASTDEWFRPVFLQHGPDGALYIADMHRKVIDHPAYVPEESRHLLDFESGKQDGRLYKVYRKGEVLQGFNATLFQSDKGLIEALQHPNEWYQQTAFQLLIESKKTTLIPALSNLVINAKLPETRTKALWLLYHFNAIDSVVKQSVLNDPSDAVREQIVRIAVLTPELLTIGDLVKLSNDTAVNVQFHTAIALGNRSEPSATLALATIAGQNGHDVWIRNAILSSIGDRLTPFQQEFQKVKSKPMAQAAVMQDLGTLIGNSGNTTSIQAVFQQTLQTKGGDSWRMATLLGLINGVAKSGKWSEGAPSPLAYLSQGNQAQLVQLRKTAQQRALNANLATPERVIATGVLGFDEYTKVENTLSQLLSKEQPVDVQLEAVNSLKRLNVNAAATLLTSERLWKSYTPRVKNAVMATLVNTPTFVSSLLDGISKGSIQPSEVNSADRNRLMNHTNAVIATRAKDLFGSLETGGRMQVYQNYKDIINQAATASAGKSVFENHCSACHTYTSIKGGNAGPDLSGVKNQPAEALLLHILVPNYEVYPAYQVVQIETKDGNTVSGWVVAENENGVTIRTAFSTEVAILRKDIKELINPGISLMPDGLEQGMSKQDMLDLIAFLKSGG